MQKLLSILLNGKISFAKLTALLAQEPAMISNKISELQDLGVMIEQHGEMVKLIMPLAPLDEPYLLRELSPHQVIVQPVIDSTNQYILQNISQLEKGDVCLAEFQTAGRGRRGRQWLSPAGQVIMSLYWTLPAQANLEGLSLAVGMAIAKALTQQGAEGVSVKWPNDILLNGRKLAGILVEIAPQRDGLHHLVIGVGMNLSLPKQQLNIDQPCAELVEVLPDLDRNKLIVQLIRAIQQQLLQFEQQGIDTAFRQQWQALDGFFGKEVNIIRENHIITGIAQGIDEQGYLQLMTYNGLMHFSGGEVSLRKK